MSNPELSWTRMARVMVPRRSDGLALLLDVGAVLAGYCNHRPSNGEPGSGHGAHRYTRCALSRRHDGVHRSRNYVWDDELPYTYAPTGCPPDQPREWFGRPARWSQRVQMERWHRRRIRERAAGPS